MKYVYVLMGLLMLGSTAQAQTVLSVGNDASCDFDSLADALDSIPVNALDGEYQIKVADTIITEPVVIDKSVEITGGLLICGGNPAAGRRLEIDGDNFDSGFIGSGLRITAINTSKVIRLNNFTISNHESGLGGGISMQTILPEGNIELILKSVSLIGNTAINAGIGGGLLMLGPGNKKLLMQSVFIHNNRASRGAGVFCESNGEIEFLSGEVSSNTAEYFSSSPSANNPDSARGGGFYLENCELMTHRDPEQPDAQRIVRDNEAFRDLTPFPFQPGFPNYGGAGIFMVDSSIDMPQIAPLFIENNHAYLLGDDDNNYLFAFDKAVGAGMFAVRSNITSDSMRLIGNKARRGGGLFVIDSDLNLRGAITSNINCGYAAQEACILIENNEAFGVREVDGPFCEHHPGIGGAIYSTRSSLEIDSVLFRDNQAGYDGDSCVFGLDFNIGTVRGSAIYVNAGSAELTNNVFYRNGGYGANDVIGIGPGSTAANLDLDLRIHNSTFAEHQLSGDDDAEDLGFISHAPKRLNESGYNSVNLVIEGSLFSDSNGTLPLLSEFTRHLLELDGTSESAVRCSVLDDPADLTRLNTLVETDNLVDRGQNLLDPSNGNFNLDTAGSGVDLCDFPVLTTATILDAARHQRPRDVASVDNGGLVDVGALEADGNVVPFFDVVPVFDLVAPDVDGDPHFEEVNTGTPVTFVVRLTNNGLSQAPLNTGFRYIMRGVDPDSVVVDASIEFFCSTQPFADFALEINCENFLGPILPGGTTGAVTLTAVADGAPAVTFSYLQAVNVTFTGGAMDAIPANDFLTATLAVTGDAPIADLSITNNDLVDPVMPEELISYVLTVVNNGPAIATDVLIADDLPAEVTFFSESSLGFDCVHNAGSVLCMIPSMPPSSSRSMQINVLAPDDELDVINSASVSANEPDPNLSNNTAIETTTVMVDPDILFKDSYE